MKLYDYQLAPNPRRVRIFLAEKGITLPTVQVDLRAGEQFTPEFRAINPECTVPVLEFDDGRRIAEVIAICLYFELAHPEPALMGVGAQDRAIVADWHHRIERQGFWAIGDAFRNSAPGLMGRALPGPDDYEQIPALAERGRARTARSLATNRAPRQVAVQHLEEPVWPLGAGLGIGHAPLNMRTNTKQFCIRVALALR